VASDPARAASSLIRIGNVRVAEAGSKLAETEQSPTRTLDFPETICQNGAEPPPTINTSNVSVHTLSTLDNHFLRIPYLPYA
jgi:hypothetical protein